MNKQELIAALEAATEPSRELDEAIRKFIGATFIPMRDLSMPLIGQPEWVGGASTNARYVPFYTDSLDAALTLLALEKNCRVEITKGRYNNDWRVNFWPSYESNSITSHAPSAPLAVCLAWARSLP